MDHEEQQEVSKIRGEGGYVAMVAVIVTMVAMFVVVDFSPWCHSSTLSV